MRCFIALELPEAFAYDTAALARRLEAAVDGRFMARNAYHLTLAFLGELDEGRVREAADALDAACTGRLPVPLRSDGLGKFGRASDATLWMGIAGGEALIGLAAAVREQLADRGVPFDPKPFRPHITLARRARIPKGDLPHLVFPADDTANRVTLFKSTLDREGAVHKPLHSVELGEDEGAASPLCV